MHVLCNIYPCIACNLKLYDSEKCLEYQLTQPSHQTCDYFPKNRFSTWWTMTKRSNERYTMRKPGEITVLFIDADTLFRRAALCSLHFSGFIHISAEDSLARFLSLFWHTASKNTPCVCVRLRRTRIALCEQYSNVHRFTITQHPN